MDEDMENDLKSRLDKIATTDTNKTSTILPWDRFQNWFHCICIVTFDLELGQAMETVYPAHVKLSEKEKTNICYLSFPDSNSGCMGDTKFHFRIRQCSGRRHIPLSHAGYNTDCPAALQTDNGYYNGFVYFRQTKDKSVRRGYFQKSVVLISKLPFIQLFNYVADNIAPEYFDSGEPALEAACHDIDQWVTPCPGQTVNLPIMGRVVQVRIPCRTDKVLSSYQSKNQVVPVMPANDIMPSVHEADLFTAFQPVLPHIQMLWELVLLAEPLVVMASLPTISASTVHALVSMISPLKYCTDFRPYFTIHDSEFKEYTTKTQAPPSVILGVTNPFFAKTLQHWPHIIRIGELTDASSKLNKVKKGGNLKTLDSKPGVYTRYKAYLSKDKTILKRLTKGIQTKRPLEVQNCMLKRYLLELTQSFMIPLERYVAGLMPLQKNISPHKGAPQLKPFDIDEFTKTIEQSGPQLTSGLKGDWVGLYRHFFRCENFQGWVKYRQQEVNQKLQAIHAEALGHADLVNWIQDKEEVEVVDLILRLREKLSCAERKHIFLSGDTINKLQSHHDTIISSLPEDLQSVLKSH